MDGLHIPIRHQLISKSQFICKNSEAGKSYFVTEFGITFKGNISHSQECEESDDVMLHYSGATMTWTFPDFPVVDLLLFVFKGHSRGIINLVRFSYVT